MREHIGKASAPDNEIASDEVVHTASVEHLNRLLRGIHDRFSLQIKRGVEDTVNTSRFSELFDEGVVKWISYFRNRLRPRRAVNVDCGCQISTPDFSGG